MKVESRASRRNVECPYAPYNRLGRKFTTAQQTPGEKTSPWREGSREQLCISRDSAQIISYASNDFTALLHNAVRRYKHLTPTKPCIFQAHRLRSNCAQVDYSDPGELTLTEIRQGALGPVHSLKDSAGIVTKKLNSKRAVASKSAAVEVASPKKKPRSPVATAPAAALATIASSAKAKKDTSTTKGGKKAAITTKSAGAESASEGDSGVAARSPGKRLQGRSAGIGTGTGKENDSVSIAAAKTGKAKAKPSATASTAKGKSPTATSEAKQPAVTAKKRKQPPETAQDQPPAAAAAAAASKSKSRPAPTAFVSALIYKSPARSPAARVTGATPKCNQRQLKELEGQRIEENDDDDTPTPPQVLKRKERGTPAAEGPAKSHAAGAASQGASEVVAASGTAASPAPLSGKKIATEPQSSSPAKRQRVATPSTPGLGVGGECLQSVPACSA